MTPNPWVSKVSLPLELPLDVMIILNNYGTKKTVSPVEIVISALVK
jgi:hypothetical protein